MSNAALAGSWCPTLLASVPADHRCAACDLQGRLRDANETISLLRAEVARLSADLTRARAALYDESEAHALTAQQLQRNKGERDAIAEAFEAACEAVRRLESARDAQEAA